VAALAAPLAGDRSLGDAVEAGLADYFEFDLTRNFGRAEGSGPVREIILREQKNTATVTNISPAAGHSEICAGDDHSRGDRADGSQFPIGFVAETRRSSST
jgi:hypothetical protein